MAEYLPNPFPDFQRSLDQGSNWESLWKIDHTTIDPLRTAASFYLLQAIMGDIYGDGSPGFKDYSRSEIKAAAKFLGITPQLADERIVAGMKLEAELANMAIPIMKRAEKRIDRLMDKTLDSFANYIDMASGGELRHHPNIGGDLLPEGRPHAWGVWKSIRDEHGTEALDVAARYFRDFRRAGYGGEAWATGPELLASYERGELGPDVKSNRRMFMDRVFTLVHNNGCMLNKLAWGNDRVSGEVLEVDAESPTYLTLSYLVGEEIRYFDLGYMQLILDAHSCDPPDTKILRCMADEASRKLWDEYIKVKEGK